MKNLKSYMKRILGMTAACACLLGGTAWATSRDSAEVQAVKEAFIASQEIRQQIGYFESETGRTDVLTDEEIQAYIDEFDAQMDRYYAEDNSCREMYKEINEQLLRDICKEQVEYVADGGVLDCTFRYVSIRDDGTTATLKAVCTSWGNWVEENEDGNLQVIAPVGQDTITATMVNEDGLWKLGKIDSLNVVFGADIINEMQCEAETAALDTEAQNELDTVDDYTEKTLTEYESFDEALAVANSLNPDEINPFAMRLYHMIAD